MLLLLPQGPPTPYKEEGMSNITTDIADVHSSPHPNLPMHLPHPPQQPKTTYPTSGDVTLAVPEDQMAPRSYT